MMAYMRDSLTHSVRALTDLHVLLLVLNVL